VVKKTISIKGEEFNLVTKVGLTDRQGNFIIPKEYDKIEKVTDNLFAAIEYRNDNEIFIYYDKIKEMCYIDLYVLRESWEKAAYKEKVFTLNVDFYSTKGKLRFEKKILAFYWSKMNEMLILLDDSYRWSIATINYEKQKIQVFDGYTDIDRIMEFKSGTILFKRNGRYEIITEKATSATRPVEWKEVKVYENGIVTKSTENKYGFVNCSGKVILNHSWDRIIPKADFIEVHRNKPRNERHIGIYSYSGQVIVPCNYISIEIDMISGKSIFVAKRKDNDNYYYDIFSLSGKVSSSSFSIVELNRDGDIIYSLEGKYALGSYDEENNKIIEVIPAKYDKINFVLMDKKYVSVRKGRKIAIYHTSGKIYKRFRYSLQNPEEKILYI